jgi:hypothetical protein
MPTQEPTEEQPVSETTTARESRDRREEPMEDEEKVLAGRPDANIPALLTRDVLGG